MKWAGPLEKNQVWEGDIHVSGDVVVPEGITLSLRPGTKVFFAPKPLWACAVFRSSPENYPVEVSCRESCDLVVLGRLEIAGSEPEPVVIGADAAAWGGIVCLGKATAVIYGASIKGSQEPLVQVFDDARVTLQDCRLSDAQIGIWAWGFSRVIVDRGLIAVSRCGVLSCDGALIRLKETRLENSLQGCAVHGWSSLKIENGRFSGHREHPVSAWQHAWAKLRNCRVESSGNILVQDKARVEQYAG